MTLDSALLDDLAGRISGRVLRPADDGLRRGAPGPQRAHRPDAGRDHPLPKRSRRGGRRALRAGCGLDIAVRGGGHNVAGRAVADDAVMIDLAEMKGTEVDAEARTVRAEGGVTWAELNGATAEHGLAVTGGVISIDGDRRADAWRRAGLADGKARARGRQPTAVELVNAAARCSM